MAGPLLSKSKYLSGLQCLKYLWLQVNRPDVVPKPDSQTRHLFDQGHLVQTYAEKLFPEGVRLPESSFRQSIELSAKFLKSGQPFFEAGILAGNLYSRVDVLTPVEPNLWDIIEVKSSTKVKDENVEDVSFQKHCCEQRGIRVNKCFVLHINNQYVRYGEIDPKGLLHLEDVTERVVEAEPGIQTRVATMLEVMSSKTCPDGRVGQHCQAPYECPVTLCKDSLPDNTVLELYRGGSKRFELLNQGVCFLRDIPDSVALSGAQRVQKWCDANGLAHVDNGGIKLFLDSLHYPVHYMDFETFNPAIPMVDGTSPYQQVPFQFSVHVVDKPGAMAWAFGHLSENAIDPRPQFISELKRVLGKKGSIVSYNSKFEEKVLRDLGEAFPDDRGWVEDVVSRMVDLLGPFREFQYYHPAQQGSASIKAVMPALTGRGYEGLEISVGDEASLAYLDMMYGTMQPEEKTRTRQALEAYCGRDTEGMVWMVDALRELSR